MSVWFGKAAFLVASVLLVVIRAPHGHRSVRVPVVRSDKGALEKALLTLAWLAFFVPLVWVFSSVFAFAEYALDPLAFAAGVALYAVGLWLFYRSHADLGTNWSITLELRAEHSLVTGGVYRRVRHPMYLSFLVFSAGQALVIPNWLVGPTYGVVMVLLVVLRLGPEERMMQEAFGAEYDAYAQHTRRLVPGVW